MSQDATLPWEHDETTFEVRRHLDVKQFVLLWVYYPKCPSPDKVMVFDRDTLRYQDGKVIALNRGTLTIKECGKIFPHFGRASSPIARFAATEEGWAFAVRFAAACS